MKQVLKYAKFTLLRLMPTTFLLFLLYSDVRISLRGFHISGTLRAFLPEIVFTLCFVFLGFASVLKTFKRTAKLAVISQYIASAMAFIYIAWYVFTEIETIWLRYSLGMGYTPPLIGSILEIQDEMHAIAFVMVIVTCFLKDSFLKTKRILAVLCACLIFIAGYCAPLHLWINYNDTLGFRVMFNAFLFSYCYCAVVITGLLPFTMTTKTVPSRSMITPAEKHGW